MNLKAQLADWDMFYDVVMFGNGYAILNMLPITIFQTKGEAEEKKKKLLKELADSYVSFYSEEA